MNVDVVSIVASYSNFLDCFMLRLTCKEYSKIKQSSICPSLIHRINKKTDSKKFGEG